MKVVFFGTTDFAAFCLNAVVENGYNVVGVVTTEDKPANRGHKIAYSPVKQYALENNLFLLQPNKLKDEDFLNRLSLLEADIQIVVAFRMLPKEVYSMPKKGTFNLHASLLPKYRGAAPINWAIINGDKTTGLTTFFLNDRIDEGEIIFQQEITIESNERFGQLYNRMMIRGGELVVKTLKAIENNSYKVISQKDIQQSYSTAPKIYKDMTYINWENSGKNIENFVRGLSPNPCARAIFYDKITKNELILKIFEVKFTKKTHKKNIGDITINKEEGFVIYCLDGIVEIIELQQSGKKPMSVLDFLRGNRIEDNLVIKK
ncbi:MAG: methionyl-tRNA formyltransferase [Bacteroidales bacterium]|jgi:methionyl-tRNA formyltransferase|nr:methionyl-tRNA formyltransferase [Bacteroidales bacterium]